MSVLLILLILFVWLLEFENLWKSVFSTKKEEQVMNYRQIFTSAVWLLVVIEFCFQMNSLVTVITYCSHFSPTV
jgi:ABC-type spermidine/putrescine transport system permease subunit I